MCSRTAALSRMRSRSSSLPTVRRGPAGGGARPGIRRQTAARLLKEAGVKIRRQGLDWEQLAEAVRLYDEGSSCQRLGERFGVDHGTVWRALKLAGVVMRRPWEQ